MFLCRTDHRVGKEVMNRSFRVSWNGEMSESSSYWGASGFGAWTTSPSPSSSLGSVIQKHGFSYQCYAQIYLSLQPDDPTVAACILSLPDGQFLLDKVSQPSTQPCADRTACGLSQPAFHHFSHPARCSSRNLGVVIDDQLNFIDHIARTARSSKFSLSNIKKISPFLSKHAPQLLVQALVLSRWTTAMLSLQAIQHANDPECCSKSGL